MNSQTSLGLSALAIAASAVVAPAIAPVIVLGALGVAAYSSTQEKREAYDKLHWKQVGAPAQQLGFDAELVVRSKLTDAHRRMAEKRITLQEDRIKRNLALMAGTVKPAQTITVPAVPVAAPIAASGYVDAPIEIGTPFSSEVIESELLEVRDLWQELEASNRHIWLVATTQSGKTWAEYAILTHGFDRSGGRAQAIVTDIKGSAFKGQAGIQDYYFSDKTDDMPRHVGNIKKALTILSSRRHTRVANGGTWEKGQKPAPLFVVIPELNSFIKKCFEWDVLNPPPKPGGEEPPRLKLAQECGIALLEIITQGLEDNVRLIVDAQTSRIEEFNFGGNVKFTGGTRNNLSMAGLSRGGDYVGMRDFLKWNCAGMQCIRNGQKIDPEDVIVAYDKQQQDKDVPCAATNMGGSLRLVQTPAIDISKIKRNWQPIKVIDRRDPPAPATQQVDKPEPPSGAPRTRDEFIETLKQWANSLDSKPSRVQVAAKVEELTGQPFSDASITEIMQLLNL
jgi:hypothetical protein